MQDRKNIFTTTNAQGKANLVQEDQFPSNQTQVISDALNTNQDDGNWCRIDDSNIRKVIMDTELIPQSCNSFERLSLSEYLKWLTCALSDT
ncbi:hypothetical protein CEXT_728451 [Caerostris extrusa]|uniref:Uncharacterized protein n=1 Tax=Caerostris extrusa TaxID=172846 RepID=A0AAV4XP38_CAEEX|nr:hypothetical protein CEXT_728451 [Caerostris extrusa]